MTYIISSFKTSELSKDLGQWFTTNVGQNVQSASVRHTHDDTFHTQVCTLVNDLLHCRD